MAKFDYIKNLPLYKEYKNDNYIKEIKSLKKYIIEELKEEPTKIEIDLVNKNVKMFY